MQISQPANRNDVQNRFFGLMTTYAIERVICKQRKSITFICFAKFNPRGVDLEKPSGWWPHASYRKLPQHTRELRWRSSRAIHRLLLIELLIRISFILMIDNGCVSWRSPSWRSSMPWSILRTFKWYYCRPLHKPPLDRVLRLRKIEHSKCAHSSRSSRPPLVQLDDLCI